MVLDNFLGDIQPQAGAVFFSITEEWLKDVLSHAGGYPRPVVADPDLKSINQVAQSYRNRATFSRDCGAGVQQQVVKHALQLLGVESSFRTAFAVHPDFDCLVFAMQSYDLNGTLHNLLNVATLQTQRFASAGELEQRFDQFRHIEDRSTDFLKQFLTIVALATAVSKKLRVGINRGKMMPQVVRNRIGHPADRGQALGLEELALRTLNSGAHLIERTRQLANLIAGAQLQWIFVVSATQRAHAVYQLLQRSRDGVRNQEHERDSGKHRNNAHSHKQAIE